MKYSIRKNKWKIRNYMRQLRQICRSVPPFPFQSLVITLVLSRLDYDNTVLIGLPLYLMCCLQSVLNMVAQLIYHLWSTDHITDALATHPSLAARPRTDHIQDHCAVVQSPPRKSAAIPVTPRSCVRSARSTGIHPSRNVR